MRRGLLVALLVLAGVVPREATAQALATLDACLLDLDQARILVRMLGQGRGAAEMALAEAQARLIQLQREADTLRKQIETLKKNAEAPPK